MLTRRQARLLAGHIDAVPGHFKSVLPIQPESHDIFRLTVFTRVTKPTRRQTTKKLLSTHPPVTQTVVEDNAFHPPDSPATSTLSTAEAAVAAPDAAVSTTYVPLDYAAALKHVIKGDPKLAEVIETTGKECRIFEGESYGRGGGGLDAFRALATAIIYQQLR